MDRTSITPIPGSMSSGVIEMRELAHRTTMHDVARSSVPTMDLVLSVVSPTAPLAAPMAIEIRRASPQPRWSAAQMLTALAVAGGVAWAASFPMSTPVPREAPAEAATEAPDALPSIDVPKSPAELHTSTAQTAAATAATTPRRRRGPAIVRPTETTSPSAIETAPRESSPIDELMRRVSTSSEPGASSTSARTLPATPDRDAVRSAMRSVAPAVAACTPGNGGTVPVTLIVEGTTGRVIRATVGGDLAGTPAAACIADAASAASLSPFARATFTVQYPFAL